MYEVGRHSGVRLVHINLSEQLPIDQCPACDSTNIRIERRHYPSVNYLEPVRGDPYPTYAAEWAIAYDSTCRDCGARWGRTEFTGEMCSPDDLPFHIDNRKRIDKDFE